MNDKEFCENCKAFANDVIGFYSDWRKSLTEPEHWLDTMEDTSQLATAALLYIAANMPSIEEDDLPNREQQSCAFCDSGKDKQQLIDNSFEKICLNSKIKAITLENKKQFADSREVVSSVAGSFPIAYCPVCGRKL